MKHGSSSAACTAYQIERPARCKGKTGEGKVSTEAIASILELPGEPIFRDRGVAGVGSLAFSISPQLNLRSPKTPESTPTHSCTAVQHLTKALFLSKPVEPPLSSGGMFLPIEASGTSVLQACQLLGYISLFRPQVLILDEPDSHLHPDNQRSLCALIQKLSLDRGFQALISSHSRHVLDALAGTAKTVWLHKGTIVEDTNLTTTQLLLDIGALDSVDYFAGGEVRFVVATEDSNTDAIRALLWSNEFLERETDVRS